MSNYKNIIRTNALSTTVNVVETADSILQASDWTQLPDSGLTSNCVTSFATYRASIRTIRKTNPANPTWPDAPEEEWS
jgi:hypothetical protein|tara:strand:- start:692 stop:925 length:234 start_codon:yes stop_codon:yes gene_type:complete